MKSMRWCIIITTSASYEFVYWHDFTKMIATQVKINIDNWYFLHYNTEETVQLRRLLRPDVGTTAVLATTYSHLCVRSGEDTIK